MILTIFGEGLRVVYYLLMMYYLIIVMYTICTWIESLYYTKLFSALRTIVSPFTKLCSGRLVVGGGFDLGYMLGLIVFYFLLNVLRNISYMI